MTRTPQEVISDHLASLAKRDVSLIVQDYTDDAILISPQGAVEGLAGVEAFYTQALGGLPDLDVTVTSSVFGGDALLARWTARASAGKVDDGVDTFVFSAGKIRLQTSWFTIEPTA
ncbi:nuclear transport factor 2 family protein [Nakamurella sp. GG22]